MHIYSDPASERHVNELAMVEHPDRLPAALAGIERAESEGTELEHRHCEPASEETMAAVHDPAYLRRLERLSDSGGGALNLDTSLSSGSLPAATLASGAAIGAVESALSGEAAFSIARPPGHHAGPGYGMGFCLLNHAAVAARHARSRGLDRVAVLDWDVHHGNGTQDIFYGSNEVLYLSVHQSPFYPGTGDSREVGEGPGQGFTANVPLPRRSSEESYAEVFSGIFLPILREYQPELVLVSAGYDSHASDPIGGMRLESGSFGRFTAEVSALTRELGASPPAFILEGGYDLAALTESVAATVRGISGEPPNWQYRRVAAPVEAARRELAPFWESLR